ncbi:MAG: carbon-nitrogen hydrolase family protein [Hyphomicrobiaceae bacterium]|nr:carbon-nitrogen hydrolase family protein [Hyphomicrobiaceae bacterium]
MTGRDLLEVAVAQYPIGQPATMAEWREKAASWVARGAATGARLLVFPEYGAIEAAATFGAGIASDLQATLAAVAGIADEMNAFYAGLAASHGVHILGPSGPVRRADGAFVNAARLVTPAGRAGVQEKLIMTPFERDWGIAPGRVLRVFETALGRIGVAICYDSEFPLLVRAMTEAGANLVLIPSCTERISGYHRVRAAACARALESQIATAVSPTVGEAPWSPAVDRNAGAAGIYVPPEAGLSLTGVLAEGRLDEPGWVAAEIDFTALGGLRTGGEMRNATDWDLQPGAKPLAGEVEVVSLVS